VGEMDMPHEKLDVTIT